MSVAPHLPAFPNVWIDPNLLQLVGLGTAGDPYLQDGRHLRWFFGRLLGFPRSGFHLRRHRAPFGSDAEVTKQVLNLMGLQEMSEAQLDGGNAKRFPGGITVEKQDGFTYTALPSGARYLRIDGKPITLSFGPQDPLPANPIGPARNNPAAYVLLTIARRQRTGRAVAEGFYDAGVELRMQDRTAVGARLIDLFPAPWRDQILRKGDFEWLRSGAERERRLTLDAISKRHDDLTRELKPILEPTALFRRLLDRVLDLFRDPWRNETLLLHGGLLDRVTITGHNAVLVRAQWLPTRLYAEQRGWKDVDRYFLPLTDAPAIYPAWTAVPGDQVAADRLFATPPRAMAPWHEPAMPPPPDAVAVTKDLKLRYTDTPQCPAFKRVDAAMRMFLTGELSAPQPQALVEIPQPMTWDGEPPPAGGSTMMFRPFDSLYSAAADPNMARLLGLMTTDRDEPAGEWDYVIGASFPLLWLYWTLFPENADEAKKRKRIDPRAIADWKEHRAGGFDAIGDAIGSGVAPSAVSMRMTFPIISMATSIARGLAPLPNPPADFVAAPKPWPGTKPIQAEVEVSWRTPSANFFEDPRSAQIFYALRRTGPDGDVRLHREDDETGVLLPIAPTKDANLDQRLHVNDRSVPVYADYTWRVSGMDIWGRFSPYAVAPARVADQVVPVAPASVTAELKGAAADAPAWTSLDATFDWTAFQAGQSADVVAFEVHVRQGKVAKIDNQNAASWGKLEHTLGAPTPPLVIQWPAATVVAPGAGLVATAVVSDIAAADGGGHRVAVSIGPMHRPFDANGFARLSVTVRALDAAGNASDFAPLAVGTRVDEAPPAPAPLLPGPLRSSYPDARGRAFFRIVLGTPAGMTVQVMRASQAVLLAKSGTTTAAFEAMNEGERVAHLKALAIQHRSAFAADHELPYGDAAVDHRLELTGLSRDWTVAMLQRISRTGVRGAWPNDPDDFAVIAVPRPPQPSKPVLIEARPGDRELVLRFAPDPNGNTRTLRILHTRDAAKAQDVRRMQPVLELDVDAIADGDPIAITDDGLLPDAVHFYRVVGLGNGGLRSEPTEIVAARPYSTVPPPAPVLTSVVRQVAPPNVTKLTFTIPRRDYRVTVLRRMRPGAYELISANGVNGFIDLAALTVTAVAAGYEVTLFDTIPDPASTYVYRVRVRDPRDRFSDGAEVEETP